MKHRLFYSSLIGISLLFSGCFTSSSKKRSTLDSDGEKERESVISERDKPMEVRYTFLDTINRPVLAQTFQENATGEALTIAINHFESKGASKLDDDGNTCGVDIDPGNEPNCDQFDGQGYWNEARTDAATALVNWLATDPTDSGDPDFLIIGDLNAYAQEDPIKAITNAGYTNLLEALVGAGAYSFVFFGQAGSLDHALSSPTLTSQVTGVTVWHINADEPRILDYNEAFKSPGQITSLYTPDPYRSSDHDPVIVGLELITLPPLPPSTRPAIPEPSAALLRGQSIRLKEGFSAP